MLTWPQGSWQSLHRSHRLLVYALDASPPQTKIKCHLQGVLTSIDKSTVPSLHDSAVRAEQDFPCDALGRLGINGNVHKKITELC